MLRFCTRSTSGAAAARARDASLEYYRAAAARVRYLCAGADAAPTSCAMPVSAAEKAELKATQSAEAIAAWDEIRNECMTQVQEKAWVSGDLVEFGVDNFLYSEVLSHATLACGLSNSIGGKLLANQANDGGVDYNAILLSAFKADPDICSAVAADMQRFKVVDPACDGLLGVYLFYKGIQAIACARGESTRQTRSSALLPCVPPHCRHTTFIPRLTCFPQSRTTFGRHAAAQANSSPSSYSRRRPTVR